MTPVSSSLVILVVAIAGLANAVALALIALNQWRVILAVRFLTHAHGRLLDILAEGEPDKEESAS